MAARLIAVLLALGMIAISAQATDPITADSALVDDANDEVVLIEHAIIVEPPPVRVLTPAPDEPIAHQPEIVLFRPPRAVA